jgi:type III secretion protein L
MEGESTKVVKIIKGKDKSASPGTVGDSFNIDSMERDGVIKGEIYSATSKAREILQKAQDEAQEIVRKAHEEKEREKQDGYQAGYQEGLAQVTELLAKARVEYEQTLKNASKDMLNLAFKIAEKIVGKQMELDKNIIMDIVFQALQTVRQSRQITLRVNPDDAKVLKANKDAFLEKLGQGREIDVVEDKKVEKGGCIIESEIGVVEAQLQTQLERLKKVLMESKSASL